MHCAYALLVYMKQLLRARGKPGRGLIHCAYAMILYEHGDFVQFDLRDRLTLNAIRLSDTLLPGARARGRGVLHLRWPELRGHACWPLAQRFIQDF
jgi:hypothetical protein